MARTTKKAVRLEMVGSHDKNKSGWTSKFWEGWVNGKSLFIRFGKRHSDGQFRCKHFRSPKAAALKLARTIDRKLAKGYEYA
jgi:predicted DNA-binding WGR domain protein